MLIAIRRHLLKRHLSARFQMSVPVSNLPEADCLLPARFRHTPGSGTPSVIGVRADNAADRVSVVVRWHSRASPRKTGSDRTTRSCDRDAAFQAVGVLLPMFEEPKPQKRPKDLCLHCEGSLVPWRFVQHADDGDSAQTRKTLTRLPVGCCDRQWPEHYARVLLWPSLMQAATKYPDS